MGKLVLVVDDSLTIRRAAELVFLSTDYEVVTAASGRDALALIEQGRMPDIVLADARMPGIDGYDLCAKLNERPETEDIPALLMVDEAGPEAARAEAADIDGYLIKPFSSQDILNPVRMLTGENVESVPLSFEELMAQRKRSLGHLTPVSFGGDAKKAPARSGSAVASRSGSAVARPSPTPARASAAPTLDFGSSPDAPFFASDAPAAPAPAAPAPRPEPPPEPAPPAASAPAASASPLFESTPPSPEPILFGEAPAARAELPTRAPTPAPIPTAGRAPTPAPVVPVFGGAASAPARTPTPAPVPSAPPSAPARTPTPAPALDTASAPSAPPAEPSLPPSAPPAAEVAPPPSVPPAVAPSPVASAPARVETPRPVAVALPSSGHARAAFPAATPPEEDELGKPTEVPMEEPARAPAGKPEAPRTPARSEEPIRPALAAADPPVPPLDEARLPEEAKDTTSTGDLARASKSHGSLWLLLAATLAVALVVYLTVRST